MIGDLIAAYAAWLAVALLGSLGLVGAWAFWTRLAGDGL